MAARFIDCQKCGAMVVEHRWQEHEADHASGEFQTLSPVEVHFLNQLAHAIAPVLIPEDFLPEPDPETSN